MKRKNGFTLIEVLIVIVIISIVTSVALLSIRYNDNKQAEAFASELVQQMTLAEEKALLQPMVIGIRVENNAVKFYYYKKNTWIPLHDKLLAPRDQDKFALELQTSGEKISLPSSSDEDEARPIPQIIISTNGDITPFKLYIGKPGQDPCYVIIGHADGNVSLEAL